MNMATKNKVMQANLKEWLASRGDRKERGILTNRLASLLKLHVKSVSRAMKRLQLKDSTVEEKRGRPVYFGKDVDAAIYQIWVAMEYPCAENMHSAITKYIGFFIKENNWNVDDEATGKLNTVSLGTLKARIRTFRKKDGMLRGRSATVSSPLKGMIPIRKSHTWQELSPGYVQTDSVVHCGDMLTADVIYSVGCVDFATYWSEYTAQWNKGQEATLLSLKLIRDRFPFPLCEIHPDTGNEFINYHVYEWAKSEGLDMTRSEPYKKNDNMCIEERNNSIARKHLGYARLDDKSLVPVAMELLHTASLLHNHFKPVRRMLSKVRIGAKWQRTFEKVSKTPYERVLLRTDIEEASKTKLREINSKLNPLELKRNLDILKEKISKALRKKCSRVTELLTIQGLFR